MRDELVFGAGWRGRPMAAQEAANAMREFLVGLARISSWEPPCDVSGSTKRPAPLAIAEDLSDFDDAVLKAITAASFRASEAETGNVAPCAETAFGWCARFSDAPQRKTEEHTISIDIRLGASDRFGDSGIAIRVPSYKSYVEENGIWVMDELEHPQAIFEYLMDFLDPYCCAIHSTGFLDGISVQRSEGMGGLLLGPMSYNPECEGESGAGGRSAGEGLSRRYPARAGRQRGRVRRPGGAQCRHRDPGQAARGGSDRLDGRGGRAHGKILSRGSVGVLASPAAGGRDDRFAEAPSAAMGELPAGPANRLAGGAQPVLRLVALRYS